LLYGYWATVLQLLKIGIAWEAIKELSEGEIAVIMGIESAIQDRQSEEQAREMARKNMNMNNMGVF
tara:strand:- start:2691 stop:2888 length:198 start_codon:yes stop_codon:yes gene_type:complete